METKNNEIERLLFKIKGTIIFRPDDYIEVHPGIMAPMIVNVKATMASFEVRSKIVKELIKRTNPETTCICGIESGGSYYASAVADALKKPLVLFRKKSKGYGVGERFVGNIPEVKNGLVTIIDDVIAGGIISTEAIKALKVKGCRVEVVVIYSYLPKLKGMMSKIKVAHLSNINDLLATGKEIKFFTDNDIKLIREAIANF